MMAQKSAKLITRLITDHVEVLCRERTVKKAGVKRLSSPDTLRLLCR
jgi:hypothetical protein